MQRADLLQGTLDLLILKALTAGPLYGWAISRRIQTLSCDVLAATQGSLYPALYRLEDRGWVLSSEAESAGRRRVRVYELTATGVKQLADQTELWRVLSAAIQRVLATN
jgi:transcriptional regulator